MDYKTIEAGGKSYRLSFTTNALCQLEDKVDGVSLASMAVRRVNSFLRYMFWAALITHRPKTTLEEAGCIADEYIKEQGGRKAALQLFKELQEQAGIASEDDDSKKAETPTE